MAEEFLELDEALILAEIMEFDDFFASAEAYQLPVAEAEIENMDFPDEFGSENDCLELSPSPAVQASTLSRVEQFENGVILAQMEQLHVENQLPRFDQTFPNGHGNSGVPVSVLPSVPGQIELARSLLATWRRNEMAKVRNLNDTNPAAEDLLNHIQTINNGICASLHLLSPEEQHVTQEAMRHNLLVVTTHPSCANATRIITTTHNFYAEVQILLGEQFYDSKRLVRATILDQYNQPALAATSGAGLGLLEAKLEQKQENDIITWNAQFSPRISERPTRMEKSSHPEMKTINDENFWVHFGLELKIKGCLKPMFAEAISFPVKIAVHGTQVKQSLETLVWDPAANMFGIQPISQRPLILPYTSVMHAINTRFARVTGHPLQEYDFRQIVIKLLGPNFFDREHTGPELQISLADFRTPKIISWTEKDEDGVVHKKTTSLSLWDWFFQCESFTTKFLQFQVKDKKNNTKTVHSLWKDRKVMGYIPVSSAYATLEKCVPGTFMLRYSTATPKAISVDYKDPEDGKICSLRMSEEQLRARSLPDRIMRISELKFLYSSIYADKSSSVRKEDTFRSLSGGFHYYVSPFQASDNNGGIIADPYRRPHYVRAVDAIQLQR